MYDLGIGIDIISDENKTIIGLKFTYSVEMQHLRR